MKDLRGPGLILVQRVWKERPMGTARGCGSRPPLPRVAWAADLYINLADVASRLFRWLPLMWTLPQWHCCPRKGPEICRGPPKNYHRPRHFQQGSGGGGSLRLGGEAVLRALSVRGR